MKCELDWSHFFQSVYLLDCNGYLIKNGDEDGRRRILEAVRRHRLWTEGMPPLAHCPEFFKLISLKLVTMKAD